MSGFLKAEQVVNTALGILEREVTLPGLVWSDAVGDFSGAKDDTITIRVPAYARANKRAMRSGAGRQKSKLHERGIDVKLDTNVYMDVPISDEEMSLDISDFGAQVLNRVLPAIAEGLEDEIRDVLVNAPYRNVLTHDISADNAYNTVVAVRTKLNDANVPQQGRALAVGSNFEAALLTCDNFVRADASGSTDTLREAKIGRIAGFDVYSIPALPPDVSVAFHKTAVVIGQRAPVVPAGAGWGASANYQGLAIRTLRDYDADETEDRFLADAYIGVTEVKDDGYWVGGKFQPATEAGASFGAETTLATSAASDDIVDTATPHGLSIGDGVQFTELTGGTGLSVDTTYYVVSASFGASTFRIAETPGGTPIGWSADITAGKVAIADTPQFVRAVKIVTVP
jgi:hypothetical protein